MRYRDLQAGQGVEAPPGLAWGERGVEDVIPPSATVMFRVELISLEDPGGT